MAAPSLEPMAAELAPRGALFVFVYVREAHPGEHYPHHTSLEQKLAHARAFRVTFDTARPVLVDDLVGTAHRLYGTLPNMTYVVGGTPSAESAGTVLFRANWTDAGTVRAATEYLLLAQERRRCGERLAPFYAEVHGYRVNDPARFRAGLERAGPKAVAEFEAATARWRRGAPGPMALPPREPR